MATLASLGGWPALLTQLMAGGHLSRAETAAALSDVFEGAATPAQLAAFLTALRMKGETVEEMTGLVEAVLSHAEMVVVEEADDVVDTCGTGGDRSGSINVSTLSALVVAGAGARVVKHGNRAASSATGSADVLEALGVRLDVGPEGVLRCLEASGMAFCFAPRFHPAFRHAGPTRRELGVPTVFNVLGPLANPARPGRQVLGVSSPPMAERMIRVLAANGVRRAMVVYGHDGFDELTTTTTSTILDLVDGEIAERTVDPGDLGLARATADDLRGGDAAANAEAVRRLLEGERGPKRDIVLLNAAAAAVVAGLAETLVEGLEAAAASLDEGKAASVLERLVTASGAEAAPVGA